MFLPGSAPDINRCQNFVLQNWQPDYEASLMNPMDTVFTLLLEIIFDTLLTDLNSKKKKDRIQLDLC